MSVIDGEAWDVDDYSADDDYPYDLPAGDVDPMDAAGGLGGIDFDEDEGPPREIRAQPDSTFTEA